MPYPTKENQPLKIGICYDRPEEYVNIDGPADRFAEFEPESTIVAMEAAVRLLGHEAVRLGGPFSLLKSRPDVDLIWNIAEGYGSRNREAWVPGLCEMYRIPYLGSDGFTLSLSLDKVATKQLARRIGIPTPDWAIYPSDSRDINASNTLDTSDSADNPSEVIDSLDFKPSEALDTLDSSVNPSHTIDTPDSTKYPSEILDPPPFPLFLKPRYEGTAKGITPQSVVKNSSELQKQGDFLRHQYKQDVLVEAFLPGAEYTVAVSGHPLVAHPVLERGIDTSSGIGIHVLDSKGIDYGDNYSLSHQLTPELEEQLQKWSLRLCREMGVVDFARLDFKCDSHGRPFFLEINPLPTFAVDNTFAILAELEGVSFDEFLGSVLKSAIARVIG